MRSIGRRSVNKIRLNSKKVSIEKESIAKENLENISVSYMPNFSEAKDPVDTPENLDHTAVVYIDNNNRSYLDQCLSNLSDIKTCVINDSSEDIPCAIKPELHLGKAGAINYSFSFIETSFMSIVDPEDVHSPVLDFKEACLIESPTNVEGLWSSAIIPRIISMRVELAKMIGFNWDLVDPGIVIKEFIFYFASQFSVSIVDHPPYSCEKNRVESVSIRKSLLAMYPYLFVQKRASSHIIRRVPIKPLIIR